MKLKIFIIHLILSVIFFTNNSFSKTLPQARNCRCSVKCLNSLDKSEVWGDFLAVNDV